MRTLATCLILFGISTLVPLYAIVTVDIGAADPPCPSGYQGFSGTASEGTVTVEFRSCAQVEEGKTFECRSSFSTTAGSSISEVVLTNGDQVTMFIGGVDIANPSSWTQEEKDAIAAALQSQEGDVITRLWGALLTYGLGPSPGPQDCLWRQSQLWQVEGGAYPQTSCADDCNNQQKKCLGCCGAGCTAVGKCEGACTQECRTHDEDCGSNPFNHIPGAMKGDECMKKLSAAMSSAAACVLIPGCGGSDEPACPCC